MMQVMRLSQDLYLKDKKKFWLQFIEGAFYRQSCKINNREII